MLLLSTPVLHPWICTAPQIKILHYYTHHCIKFFFLCNLHFVIFTIILMFPYIYYYILHISFSYPLLLYVYILAFHFKNLVLFLLYTKYNISFHFDRKSILIITLRKGLYCFPWATASLIWIMIFDRNPAHFRLLSISSIQIWKWLDFVSPIHHFTNLLSI